MQLKKIFHLHKLELYRKSQPNAEKNLLLPGVLMSYRLDSCENKNLVNILSINPRIQIDLRYATANNFTGKIIYDFKQCLLIRKVAKALSCAQNEIELLGLGLKIWDGFRPMSAQWEFWKLIPDERYVSDPRKGGRHTRGTSVDLTLIDGQGHELLMPTPFDDFSEKAHQGYTDLPQEAIYNRELLRDLMKRHGFHDFATEWWHFDFAGWENHPPIDILIR